MFKISLFMKSGPAPPFKKMVELSRVPNVGEYVRIGVDGGSYKVVTVVHNFYAGAESEADVFVVEEEYTTSTIEAFNQAER